MTETEFDRLYDKIDEMLHDGQFRLIDEMFNGSVEDPDFVLSLLTITLPAKSKLNKRQAFYAEAEKKFGKELLQGLE